MDRLSPEKIAKLRALSLSDAIRYWDAMETEGRRSWKLNETVRLLCEADLYYLLTRACKRL